MLSVLQHSGITDLRGRQMVDEKNIITVSQLNNYVKLKLETDQGLSRLFVRGEISNLKTYGGTGHLYFTLKDERAQVSAVMFSSYTLNLKFLPKDGMKVIAIGKVSLYPERGTYQIYLTDMQPDGMGALAMAYEQLKRRLEYEGLFDDLRKKPVPKFPKTIGVITSPTGAAVRDIMNILGRRWPIASVYLYPAIVQGDGAVPTLIDGVRFFNANKHVDVIIIGRGGGSLEDLWAFNSEDLVRTISHSVVPVISAVGHETDFTLCDFVADLRAPTPSAAAELCTPNMLEMYAQLSYYESRQKTAMKKIIDYERQRVDYLGSKRVLQTPEAFIDNKKTMLMMLEKQLMDRVDLLIKESLHSLDMTESRLNGKMNEKLSESIHSFEKIEGKVEEKYKAVLDRKKNELSIMAGKLHALDPLSVLSRGYSVALKEDGKTIKKTGDVKKDDELNIRVTDGTIKTRVTGTEKNGGKKNG